VWRLSLSPRERLAIKRAINLTLIGLKHFPNLFVFLFITTPLIVRTRPSCSIISLISRGMCHREITDGVKKKERNLWKCKLFRGRRFRRRRQQDRLREMPFPVLSSAWRYQQRHRKSVNCERIHVGPGAVSHFSYLARASRRAIFPEATDTHLWTIAPHRVAPETWKAKHEIYSDNIKRSLPETKPIIFSLFLGVIARHLLRTRGSDTALWWIL